VLLSITERLNFATKKNNLGCDLILNPPQNQTWGSWLGWGKTKSPTDYLIGSVFKSRNGDLEDEANRELISTAEGTWLGSLEFDGKIYWDWQLGLPKFTPRPVDDPLPSDCRFREDLIALAKGDLEGATHWKQALEVKQRREAKLRKDGKELASAAAVPDTPDEETTS